MTKSTNYLTGFQQIVTMCKIALSPEFVLRAQTNRHEALGGTNAGTDTLSRKAYREMTTKSPMSSKFLRGGVSSSAEMPKDTRYSGANAATRPSPWSSSSRKKGVKEQISLWRQAQGLPKNAPPKTKRYAGPNSSTYNNYDHNTAWEEVAREYRNKQDAYTKRMKEFAERIKRARKIRNGVLGATAAAIIGNMAYSAYKSHKEQAAHDTKYGKKPQMAY